MMILATNSFADTKFHYGDKVKFKLEFYGSCSGYIDELLNPDLGLTKCKKREKSYRVQNVICNSTRAEGFYICESQLSNYE